MPYTLKQAAAATGKSKPTILRAIQSGKVSAKKDDQDEWRIEPAELHRVYPAVTRATVQPSEMKRDVTPDETAALRREVELRDERLALIEQERQRERHQLESQLTDLRQDRDHWRQQATALLTDGRERERPSGSPQEGKEGRFLRAWRILAGKG